MKSNKNTKEYTINTHEKVINELNQIISDLFRKSYSPSTLYNDMTLTKYAIPIDKLRINVAVDYESFLSFYYDNVSGMTRMNVKESQKAYNEASDFFKEWVSSCSEELILEKISKNNNRYKDDDYLMCLILASVLLACKTIITEDHMGGYVFYMLSTYDSKCKPKKIRKMEFDLYETTDYNTCIKSRNKMYGK